MLIGNREFSTSGHTYVMGILNVTPDSFSDGGEHNCLDKALKHAELMIHEGADIIDIGGESTRPGYSVVSIEEEIERTSPVIEKIKAEFDIPVSIDTYKPIVAKAAIDAGADLINDIWGAVDDDMARLISTSALPCCLMHNRTTPLPEKDLFKEICTDINAVLDHAFKYGIDKSRIILDPGIGFAKNTAQNLQILNHQNFMMPSEYPVLLGTSRKSVIGNTLNLPTNERIEGTLVTTVLAVQNKSMFVRVHDVKENVRCIKMTEAILHS